MLDDVDSIWRWLRRKYYFTFRKGYVRQQIKNRKGKCGMHGCCATQPKFLGCKLMGKDGKTCTVWDTDKMPLMCSMYPFDEKDKAPYAKIHCNFYWEKDNFWDSYWSSWKNVFIVPLRFIIDNLYIMEIKKHIDGRVLELGCGSSYCARKLDTFGIDNSKNAARKRNKGKFVLGDICHLPFKSKSFGVVWSAGVLEHIMPPDNAILESKRVGKKMIAFVPSELEPLAKIGIYEEMVIHSKKSFYLLLKKFFRNVETKRFTVMIMGIGSD